MKIKEITEGILDAIAAGSRKGMSSDAYKPHELTTALMDPGEAEKLAKFQKLQKQQARQNWVQGAIEKSKDPKAGMTDKVAGWWAKKFDKSSNQTQQPQPQDQQQDQQQQQQNQQQQQQQQQNQQQQQQQQQNQQQQQQQQPRPQGNPNQNINTKIDYLKSIGVLQSARITDDERQYIESTDVWVDTNKLQGIDPSTTFFQTRAPHHHMFIRQIVVPARDLGYENNVNYQFDLTPAGWWSSMHRAYVNPNSKFGQLVDDWADSH